jgi:hypothetical protein
MYKVVVEFHQSNILAINADDPIVAAKNVNKLFQRGKATPQLKEIRVFLQESDIDLDLPVHKMIIN